MKKIRRRVDYETICSKAEEMAFGNDFSGADFNDLEAEDRKCGFV